MKNEVRPIDANELERKIREYMRSLPASTARIMEYHKVLSMLGDEGQTPTLQLGCNIVATGEPLTLEQLRGMEGKPVFMQMIGEPKTGRWVIVDYADTEHPDKTLYTKEGVTYSDYGKHFVAYTYPPTHIDREAWEPCAKCVGCGNCYYFLHDDDEYPCNKCLKESTDKNQYPRFEPIGFCKHCGRPLTEEAWAELEKRRRG